MKRVDNKFTIKTTNKNPPMANRSNQSGGRPSVIGAKGTGSMTNNANVNNSSKKVTSMTSISNNEKDR